MNQNRRRESRTAFTVKGRLYAADGSSLCECNFHDVSEHGARIEIARPEDVPDEITVALSRDGMVHRRGRVVWRADKKLGLRFVHEDPPERHGKPRLRRKRF